VLISLSPELAGITYNKTLMPATAPLQLWRLGKGYRLAKEQLKQLAWRVSGGRVYIRNTTDYVDHDGWLRTDESWRRYYREMLLSNDSRLKEYLDQEYVSYLIREHDKGRINAAYQIQRPLTLEIFLRQFLA
jgi:hypothetical protein